MCGISAIITTNKKINIYNKLLISLKKLQNRGYDSAGIFLNNKNNYELRKFASTNKTTAIENLTKNNIINEYNIGIAHTRWATHGAKTDINSHPHISMNNKFVLVHNGIIENYLKLKNKLIEKEYKFKSQTDTEVIVNLLEYNYLNNIKNNSKKKIEQIIKDTINELEGTYALCIIKIGNEDLYCVRQGSPILVSFNENFCMIVSEQSGFDIQVNNYITLENNDICILKNMGNKLEIITEKNYNKKDINCSEFVETPYPYEHWTIKEIEEQIESSIRAMSLGGRLLLDNRVKLGGLESHKKELLKLDNIILLGCGTSYYASQIGVKYLQELCNFNVVQSLDGAEFIKNDIPKIGKTGLILMSQSGETKDLHRCIEIGRENNCMIIGIVNVPDSMIARESDCGVYLNAGREVAVASTKAFTSMVIVLSLISLWYAQNLEISNEKRIKYIRDLRNLYLEIKQTINICKEKVNEDMLSIFDKFGSCFILGKGIGESIAKEGSLKIKEISYIHAEGYSSSSLKHGPFALLEEDFPVIILMPEDNNYSKLENAYHEVRARHAKTIIITDLEDKESNKIIEDENTKIIRIPKNNRCNYILIVIVLQYIAYKLSIRRGINPDMPKNLAKVVTVE